jgi:acetyl esterase/lipase
MIKTPLVNNTLCFVLLAAVIVLTPCATNGQDTISASDKVRHRKDTYTYKVVDQQHIKADVFRYPDHKIRPAIIHIHGGALIFGSRGVSSDNPEVQEAYAQIMAFLDQHVK